MIDVAVSEFPFVAELPKRDKAKVANLWDKLAELRAMAQMGGSLVPHKFAAKLLGLSSQRLYQLAHDGRLERVEFEGHSFITERSLVQLARTERKNGRPLKTPKTAGEVLKLSKEYAES